MEMHPVPRIAARVVPEARQATGMVDSQEQSDTFQLDIGNVDDLQSL